MKTPLLRNSSGLIRADKGTQYRQMKPTQKQIPISFLSSLLVLAAFVFASHNTEAVQMSGQALNGQVFKARRLDFPTAYKQNGMIHGRATAEVNGAGTDVKSGKSPKLPGSQGQAGLATNTFHSTTASALVTWDVTGGGNPLKAGDPISVLATANYSVSAGGPHGVAQVGVEDPLEFLNAQGGTFEVSYGLFDPFTIQVFGSNALANMTTKAGSNIPGLETFFDLSLSVSGADPSNPQLSFVSNPNLGLNDSAISQDILSHLNYDAINQSYSIGSDFDYATFSIVVPSSVATLALSWETRGRVEAGTSVPESGPGVGFIAALFIGLCACTYVVGAPMRVDKGVSLGLP